MSTAQFGAPATGELGTTVIQSLVIYGGASPRTLETEEPENLLEKQVFTGLRGGGRGKPYDARFAQLAALADSLKSTQSS